MNRRISILLLPALLALPQAAQARPLAATLQAANGTLEIKETRCPPGSSACGTAQLDESFKAGPKPRTRSAPGRPGFPAGLRIHGKGTGKCYAESPPTTTTAPDGSTQFLGSAARVEPGSFGATRIAVRSGKRGVRIAWLEPLTPSLGCDYFDQPGTNLALPATATLPSALVSRNALARSRFSITIAGSKDWAEITGDGTRVTGRASWKLQLSFKR
jgi:hypothetical protein